MLLLIRHGVPGARALARLISCFPLKLSVSSNTVYIEVMVTTPPGCLLDTTTQGTELSSLCFSSLISQREELKLRADAYKPTPLNPPSAVVFALISVFHLCMVYIPYLIHCLSSAFSFSFN